MTSLATYDVPVAVRWTMGNVQPRGFELLRLSLHCAARLFGPAAELIVYVNSLPVAEAQARTGSVPSGVTWHQATTADLPTALLPFFDGTVIEGMGWKLAPLRASPSRFELCLDNDILLWDLPDGMRRWLANPGSVLFAEDTARALGSFDPLCPPGDFNAGIRGLSPGVTLEPELLRALHLAADHHGSPLHLTEEIEEQGLQAAAIFQRDEVFLVRRTEVSLCSPFWPRSPHPGTCGVHMVGMNARHTPFDYYDKPADQWLDEFWAAQRPALYTHAGLPLPTSP